MDTISKLTFERDEAISQRDESRADVKRLKDYATFCERWVVHHAAKDCITDAEVVGMIRCHPTTSDITRGYGEKVDETPSELETLRARVAELEGWQPIGEPVEGITVLLGAWVGDRWEEMVDDWYVDRVMAGWREWEGLFDEPPTHFFRMPADRPTRSDSQGHAGGR